MCYILRLCFLTWYLKDPARYIRQIADHIKRPLSEDTLQRIVEETTIDAMKATYNKVASSGKAHLVKGGGVVNFLAQGNVLKANKCKT